MVKDEKGRSVPDYLKMILMCELSYAEHPARYQGIEVGSMVVAMEREQMY